MTLLSPVGKRIFEVAVNRLGVAHYQRRPGPSPRPPYVVKRTFVEYLSDDERAELARSKYVTVIGSKGHAFQLYVNGGITGNVGFTGHGLVIRLCAHPMVIVDVDDVYISQYLTLKLDEDAFTRRANVYQRLTIPDRIIEYQARTGNHYSAWELVNDVSPDVRYEEARQRQAEANARYAEQQSLREQGATRVAHYDF